LERLALTGPINLDTAKALERSGAFLCLLRGTGERGQGLMGSSEGLHAMLGAKRLAIIRVF